MNNIEVRIPNEEGHISLGYMSIDEDTGGLVPNIPFKRNIGQDIQVRLVAFSEVAFKDFLFLIYKVRKNSRDRNTRNYYIFNSSTLSTWNVDHVVLEEFNGDIDDFNRLVASKR